MDAYLATVGELYYRPRASAGANATDATADATDTDAAALREHARALAWLRPAMAGLLAAPVHKVSVFDKWAPVEVARFEAGLCLWGKVFHRVQAVVKTKSTKDVIEFYYVWKKSPNYAKWKRAYVPLAL
jgi:hypothetical protein